MKRALVVGINDYGNNSLCGCINDAVAISNLLARNEDDCVNFDVMEYHDIRTKSDLHAHILECFSGGVDVELFYFSGHGCLDTIGGYIVTPDCQRYDMGVSMQDILNIVNRSTCCSKIVILDCCYSGVMGNINTQGQQLAVIGDGVTILTASKANEVSMEIGGQGVFTSLLIDALKGGAADVTGYITPGGIYAYIDKALGPWKQRPVFKTNVTRFSPLRRVRPQVDEYILRKITEYFKNPTDEFRLDPSYEPTNSPNSEHYIAKPYAVADNVIKFNDLQKLEGVGFVTPCDEEHMYFAAMNNKACKLTLIGQHYWRLVHNNII